MSRRASKRVSLAVAAIVVVLILGGLACATGSKSGAAVPFPSLSVHFEQNATDGDMEAVFEATGGADGLTQLTITGPDGRSVADFSAEAAGRFGLRGFRFETPEPSEVDSLKAAFPEGVYTFAGRSVKGEEFTGQGILNHELPPAATFVFPSEEADDVPVTGCTLQWGAASGAEFYIIEIEQDELGVNLTVRIPAAMTSFALPDGFLVSGTEYTMLIGSVDADDNVSYVETSFTTAE